MMFSKGDGRRGESASLTLPLLPLRDIIVFPHMVVPLFVGREKSIAAIDAAIARDKEIFLAAQKRPKTNSPIAEDIFDVGTIGTIHQFHRLPDGTVKVLVEGRRRGRVRAWHDHEAHFLVDVDPIAEPALVTVEIEALMRSVQSTFETYVKLNKRVPPEMLMTVQTIEEPGRLSDTVVVHLGSVKLQDRQALLETADPVKRLERLHEVMQAEIEILQVEKKIRSRVKRQMERTQKEYYLNEQMQAIQKELGERDEFKSELQELEERLKQKKLSKEASEKVRKEIKKLRMMQPMSAEATVVRNYIDWILSLPWGEKSEDQHDIDAAEAVLDDDHYGLKKIKERIIEHLAVQALTRQLRGPVLCLVGPPGVGKTSLAKSVARAMGRRFVRLALGGVRDEAEIRGHRRTYIGAMPGKIVQCLKKAGSNNPVFLLDEVDKMSSDFRGDPAAALLEVLDPEQNNTFSDHYLEIPYDLSHTMFVATANQPDPIPPPLRDRMEILEIPGYTRNEKKAIARQHLLPKQLDEHGIKEAQLEITDGAIEEIIDHYTREAGVRNLERQVASVIRGVAVKIAEGDAGPYKVDNAEDLRPYLGPQKFTSEVAERTEETGVATGLAWTPVGGEILFIEATRMHGTGKMQLTGQLGDVMKESAQAALSYVRARSKALGLPEDFLEKSDIHIHIPAGAMPKDGPSAGVTMFTALVSMLKNVRIRHDVAMTGEITLRGRVLPVGGIKEKVLAAHRAGIKRILLPERNKPDLEEVPQEIRDTLEFIAVSKMDDVLLHALEAPVVQDETAPAAVPASTN